MRHQKSLYVWVDVGGHRAPYPLWLWRSEIGCSDATARRVVGGRDRPPRGGVRPQLKGSCAANDVSRSTAYLHKKRIEELGRWESLSTRPRSRSIHQTPPEVEA